MDFVLALRITHITFTISRKTHFLICDMTDYYFQTTLFYSCLHGPFLLIGFNYLKITEPLQGGSLLFTTKVPQIPGTHFIDLGRMKG